MGGPIGQRFQFKPSQQFLRPQPTPEYGEFLSKPPVRNPMKDWVPDRSDADRADDFHESAQKFLSQPMKPLGGYTPSPIIEPVHTPLLDKINKDFGEILKNREKPSMGEPGATWDFGTRSPVLVDPMRDNRPGGIPTSQPITPSGGALPPHSVLPQGTLGGPGPAGPQGPGQAGSGFLNQLWNQPGRR